MSKIQSLKQGRHKDRSSQFSAVRIPVQPDAKVLEVVLKCDSSGSAEAMRPLLENMEKAGVGIRVIHADVGDVSKSDILLASTGSRMVLGFNVGVMPKLDAVARESRVDVRLYTVIYELIEDVKDVMASWQTLEESEKVLGKARVIALFKSDHGLILGCEVEEGVVAVGQNFRVISAMGVVHAGRVESLQLEHKPVKQAGKGKQVGLKIEEFKDGKLGDIIETYEKERPRGVAPWRARGEVVRRTSVVA